MRENEITGEIVDAAYKIHTKIELKSVEVVTPLHKKQLLTYLRLSHKPLGLLINFNTELIKNGITRIVNRL
jgi:GxxExxY protein